jgi:hypothetical protein
VDIFSFGTSFLTSGFARLVPLLFAEIRLSVLPTGDLGLVYFFSGSLKLSTPNSSPPFFINPLMLAASVFENYALYGSDTNLLSVAEEKLLFATGSLNCSSKLELCLGLKVRPRPYFSPEGERGGVKPF